MNVTMMPQCHWASGVPDVATVVMLILVMLIRMLMLTPHVQVSDTGRIEEEAEVFAAESRVEVTHQLEATLLCLRRGAVTRLRTDREVSQTHEYYSAQCQF